MTCLRDADIRQPLAQHAATTYPGAQVLHEVGLLHGQCRVDVAALSPACLHGWEIKGDTDSLKRLPSQVEADSRVLDRCTLVVGDVHVAAGLAPGASASRRTRTICASVNLLFLTTDLPPGREDSLTLQLVRKSRGRPFEHCDFQQKGNSPQLFTAQREQCSREHTRDPYPSGHEELPCAVSCNRSHWLLSSL